MVLYFTLKWILFFSVNKFVLLLLSVSDKKESIARNFIATCIHSLHFDGVNESVEANTQRQKREKMKNTIANLPEEFFQLNSNEFLKCILQSPFE